MDFGDNVWSSQGEQIVVALERAPMLGKPITTKVRLFQRILLYVGTHGAVQEEDALRKGLAKFYQSMLSLNHV